MENTFIGRIDYLGSNGKIGDSVEFIDSDKFYNQIEHDSYYGIPLKIVIYEDAVGNHIPIDFLLEFDFSPKGLEIIPSPYLYDTNLIEQSI